MSFKGKLLASEQPLMTTKRDYENASLELKYFEEISTYFSAAESFISQLANLMSHDEDYIKGLLLDVGALLKHLQTLTKIQQIRKDIQTLSLQQSQLTDQHQTVLTQRSSLTIEELNVRLETLRIQIADVTENIRQTSQVLDASNEYTELSDKTCALREQC
jgi:hypothetical protein